MQTHLIYIILLVTCLLQTGCIKEVYEDDKFVLSKTNFEGTQLRIDGYYYSSMAEDELYLLCILYRNGIAFLPGAGANHEEYIYESQKGRHIRDYWGIFVVEEDEIQIEDYKPSMLEGMPAYIKSGTILNDTTFVLEEEKRSKDGSEYLQINEVYHFRQFSPKPDSTNTFIK